MCALMMKEMFVSRVVELFGWSKVEYGLSYSVDKNKVRVSNETDVFGMYRFVFVSDGDIKEEYYPNYFMLNDTMYVFKYTITGRKFLISSIKKKSNSEVKELLNALLGINPIGDKVWESDYIRRGERIDGLEKENAVLWVLLIVTNIIWLCTLFWR